MLAPTAFVWIGHGDRESELRRGALNEREALGLRGGDVRSLQ